MTVTAVIVQARLGSTRLPAKVLLPLPTGRTVLEEVLHRCKQIPGVDVVVCAIPDAAENDIVAEFAAKSLRPIVGIGGARTETIWHGGKVVRGPEHDVLARYVKAAEEVGADIIIRVTADCPLIDPQVCGRVLAAIKCLEPRRDAVFACNNEPRTFPHGLDCEAFTYNALWRTNFAAELSADDREHVTPAMRRSSWDRHFVFNDEDRSHLRWTLDTLDDYIRIWNLLKEQKAEANAKAYSEEMKRDATFGRIPSEPGGLIKYDTESGN